MSGHSVGFEAASKYQLTDNWRLQLSYSFLDVDLKVASESTDLQTNNAAKSSPNHQLSIWSFTEMSDNFSLNAGIRYVGDVDSPAPGIHSYTSLDCHLNWKISKQLNISLVGQNMLNDNHNEFQPDFIAIQATEVERSVYAKATWLF